MVHGSSVNMFKNRIDKYLVKAVLSGKYQGGISRAVFPGKYRPVQYPLSGKYREILGNTNILLVFCGTCIFNGVFKSKISDHTSLIHYVLVNQA